MDKYIDDEKPSTPTPDEFDRYLPWACGQFEVDANVVVDKVFQGEYVNVSGAGDKSKIITKENVKRSSDDLVSDIKEDKSYLSFYVLPNLEKIIRVTAIYDLNNNLIHIKFINNHRLPQTVLKIVGLIIGFQKHVTKITINEGCDASTIYEICKFIPISNITDVCLDNTFVSEANYHILLESQNNLRSISLARCKLDDGVVENIALKLIFPLPASKTLSILNLSSNKITDIGAKKLGEALRSNRQLSYLNLAGNALTDVGAAVILNNLMKFPTTCDEIVSGKSRLMVYLKEKNQLITTTIVQLRSSEHKTSKKKNVRPASTVSQKKGKLVKEASFKSIDTRGVMNIDAEFYAKAVKIAEEILGEFNDPFSSINTITEHNNVYCLGNNTLCYLNIAFNDISYLTVKKLLEVVNYQRSDKRNPKGLINVCIEGNRLPNNCSELAQIDKILEMGLYEYMHSAAIPASGKKKIGPRSGR